MNVALSKLPECNDDNDAREVLSSSSTLERFVEQLLEKRLIKEHRPLDCDENHGFASGEDLLQNIY